MLAISADHQEADDDAEEGDTFDERGGENHVHEDATARQPEMGGRIFVNMILTAALVEGVALFGVVVGFLMAG